MSSVTQTLISMRLISSLVLHGRGVIAWLHCLCPKLKLPKALALELLNKSSLLPFVQLLTTSECVSLSHLSLYKSRGVRHSSACLSVPLALINGAPLMENYIGDVTLKRGLGEEKERLHSNERAQPSLCFAADVRLGERRDFISACLSSFSLPVPVPDLTAAFVLQLIPFK